MVIRMKLCILIQSGKCALAELLYIASGNAGNPLNFNAQQEYLCSSRKTSMFSSMNGLYVVQNLSRYNALTRFFSFQIPKSYAIITALFFWGSKETGGCQSYKH